MDKFKVELVITKCKFRIYRLTCVVEGEESHSFLFLRKQKAIRYANVIASVMGANIIVE